MNESILRIFFTLAIAQYAAHAVAQGTTVPVALSGQLAPGANAPFTVFGPNLTLNASGDVIFEAYADPSFSRQWAGRSGALNLIPAAGSKAPEMPDGVSFSTGYTLQRMSDTGDIAVNATLAGPGIDASNQSALYLGRPESLRLLTRGGQPAPGTPTGVTFSNLGIADLNSSGQALIGGGLTGPGVTDANNAGLWFGNHEALTLVTRKGDHAPGMPPGVSVSGLGGRGPNARGEFALSFGLTGDGVTSDNNGGLWVGQPGALKMIAREGDQAPGTPQGVAFNLFQVVEFNDAGQVLIQSNLRGPSVIGANNIGIWMGTPGNLALVAREGDQAPSMPDGVVFSTVLAFTPSFVNASHINGSGQVVFKAALIGPGVTSANDMSIWSGFPGHLQLVAREGDPAGALGTFQSSGALDFEPTLTAGGQVAFTTLLGNFPNKALWLVDGPIQTVADTGNLGGYAANEFGQIAYNWGDGNGEGVNLFTPEPRPGTWTVDSSGNWSVAANWAIAVPNAADAEAIFERATTAPRTVTVDVPVTIGELRFHSDIAYTIGGANSLTLDAAQGVALINAVRGSHLINAPLILADDTFIAVAQPQANLVITAPLSASGKSLTKTGAGTLTIARLSASSLSISTGTVVLAPIGGSDGTSVLTALKVAGGAAPTAKLDLTNNAAIINYTGTSPVAIVRQQILAGRGGAGLDKTWSGQGITSSAAAAANATEPESRSIGYAENGSLPLGPYTTFRGQPVDGTSLLVAYTRTGDANLDGVVDDEDVTIVGASYAPSVPNASWSLGDFDYNGFVDDDDVTLLGAFYDASAQPLATVNAESASDVAVVPEPGSSTLFICGVVAFVLFAARRRSARHL